MDYKLLINTLLCLNLIDFLIVILNLTLSLFCLDISIVGIVWIRTLDCLGWKPICYTLANEKHHMNINNLIIHD